MLIGGFPGVVTIVIVTPTIPTPLESFSAREPFHVAEVEQQPPQKEEYKGDTSASRNYDSYDAASSVPTAKSVPSIENK